jgi:DNA-binding XRE family transcriptional regulator
MRAYRGYTQQELAQIAGISKSTIALIEQGNFNPSIEIIEGLTRSLDCKLEINITPNSN